MPKLDPFTPKRWLRAAWSHFKEFNAVGGPATYVWPRWLMLRAVGLVYVLIFAEIIVDWKALIGPDGITPLAAILEGYRQQFTNGALAYFRAPSLFWLSASPGMIATLAWGGLAAAVAVVVNFWPRMMLFICWLFFLSFAALEGFFSQTQPDQLMLEVALLCIPLAPAGFWPGLAAKVAPRTIAVWALRWMFIRLMFEAGLAKFYYGGAMWRDFTAMDVMYETAPFPTIFGYGLHQLPHVFHAGEVALTFAAEIIAPALAVFGGRWGRWFAFWSWMALQVGIQITCNFGWLNIAAIALSVVLLDDAMLVSVFRRIRWRRIADFLAGCVKAVAAPTIGPWAKWGLRVGLGLQFAVGIYFYAVAPTRIPAETVPTVIHTPMTVLFASLRSANSYALFGNLPKVRYEVEFLGSNDDGETWRSYAFRYKIQRLDRMSPFIAPWYPRFEAILQNQKVTTTDHPLYVAVAERLLRREPAVMALFADDPFPDRPAQMIRTPSYRFEMNDLSTRRATGNYWRKEYVGDDTASVYVNPQGEIVVAE